MLHFFYHSFYGSTCSTRSMSGQRKADPPGGGASTSGTRRTVATLTRSLLKMTWICIANPYHSLTPAQSEPAVSIFYQWKIRLQIKTIFFFGTVPDPFKHHWAKSGPCRRVDGPCCPSCVLSGHSSSPRSHWGLWADYPNQSGRLVLGLSPEAQCF